jgi:hypothetical protein
MDANAEGAAHGCQRHPTVQRIDRKIANVSGAP